jgi:hypothetical protein
LGGKRNDTGIFTGCAGVGPPPLPDLREYIRGVTLQTLLEIKTYI